MRKGRFTEEQMVAIIREADRDQVSAVAKRHGISEQTIYTWRKRFGGLQATDVRRLRQLEAENARLKKLVAERDLEIEVMTEVAAKNWRACRLADGKLRMAGSVVSRRGGPALSVVKFFETGSGCQLREALAPLVDDVTRLAVG